MQPGYLSSLSFRVGLCHRTRTCPSRTRRTASAPWPPCVRSCWKRREYRAHASLARRAGGADAALRPPREYRSRFTSEETVPFCLRVMVGVIILYDYVHPVGAFAKSSKIDVSAAAPQDAVRQRPRWLKLIAFLSSQQMKGCIKVLKDQPPSSVEGLLNALR